MADALDEPALLLSVDPLVVGDLRRLAAAAGTGLAVTSSPAEALTQWATATVVMVGVDSAAEVAALLPPRRAGVHLVGRGATPADVFRHALDVHAESVLELPDADARVVDLLTDIGDDASGGVIGVIGGAGGAGASVFAAGLASVAAAHGPALLVDCDPLGAGVERLLGTEERPGVRWDALAQATGRLSGRSLREALPSTSGLSVLGWAADRSAGVDGAVLREVVGAARRAFEVTVLDLPRRHDDATALAMLRCDLVVLLCPLTMAGAVATARVAQALPSAVPTTVIARQGKRSGLDPADVAALVGLPVFEVMADERGLDESVGLGVGPVRSRRGPLARTASSLLARALR